MIEVKCIIGNYSAPNLADSVQLFLNSKKIEILNISYTAIPETDYGPKQYCCFITYKEKGTK